MGSTDTSRATHVRFWVVGLTTAMAVLLYLDRFYLGIAVGYIDQDLGLSRRQSDWLVSAFFWTYALAQVPSGWLSDRYGPRRVLTVYIVLWSLFTGLSGLAYSFALLLAFRFACGLAQAGAYPTSAGLLSHWVPLTARGTASGIVSTGGRLGGALAPFLTAFLLVAFVPTSTPSLLSRQDLLDVPGLCKGLSTQGPSAAQRMASTIRALLPASAQQVVQKGQDRPLTDEEVSTLVAGLNHVLDMPGLAQMVPLNDLALPREARDLARRRVSELQGPAGQRLNRLLLEAAFPKEVRRVYGAGWRPVILVYGLAGLVAAALFWWGIRDRPALHPHCNAVEIALINEGRTPSASATGAVGGMPWGPILRSRGQWLSSISQFFTNFGWIFLLNAVPRYLESAHQVPVVERGLMASVPILMGMVGMLAGGWITDVLTRRIGLRWGRSLPLTVTRLVAVGAFLSCPWLHSPWAATMAFGAVAMATDIGTPALWAFNQDVGGRYVGSVLGWGNMWGNLGAAISPLALGAVIGETGRWDLGFYACAAAYLVSAAAALGIDARVPVFDLDETKGP